MIKYKRIDKDIAQKHKNKFIGYLKEVLITNNIKIKEENIINIYHDMLKYLENQTAIIICGFDNAEMIGFIWAYEREYNEEKRYHINYFIVDSIYQKKGIGKELIDQIYSIAKETNVNKIELMVTATNKAAYQFYKNQGFEIERISLCKKI